MTCVYPSENDRHSSRGIGWLRQDEYPLHGIFLPVKGATATQFRNEKFLHYLFD